MRSPDLPADSHADRTCAASWLAQPLLEGPPRVLQEVARTALSVHYETGDARLPVLSICLPDAVLLPSSVVSRWLPAAGPVVVGDGRLAAGGEQWRVRRWWRPPRPAGLPRPPGDVLASWARMAAGAPVPVTVEVPATAYDGLSPFALVGAGPGLTPAGDDVLAGALVAAHATADPRCTSWREQTRRALRHRTTSAVSRGMLHHALDGYATPQLAEAVAAVCAGRGPDPAATRLVAVGHSSGAALLHGLLHPFTTCQLRGAA